MKTYRFHKNVFYKNISSTIYCDYIQCDKCINIRGLIIRYSADKFPLNLVRPDVVLRSFRLNLFVFSSDSWCMELLFIELPEKSIMLPPFVDSTHCLSYHLTRKGRSVADRIVSVLGYACPDITYSPSLYPITALLLHFMPGECINK